MKTIFKIEEYLPDTQQIVVRFARLHAPKLIDEYRPVAINYSKLDCYSYESFISSLMRMRGEHIVKTQEDEEPIINKTEVVNGNLDIQNMVGKVIECKTDTKTRQILKMRRIEL